MGRRGVGQLQSRGGQLGAVVLNPVVQIVGAQGLFDLVLGGAVRALQRHTQRIGQADGRKHLILRSVGQRAQHVEAQLVARSLGQRRARGQQHRTDQQHGNHFFHHFIHLHTRWTEIRAVWFQKDSPPGKFSNRRLPCVRRCGCRPRRGGSSSDGHGRPDA